jgi:CHAT domain-containing protein
VGLMLLASAVTVQAQGRTAGADSRSPSAQRPEEAAANLLLENGKQREALLQLDRAATAYRRAGDHLALARVALTRSGVRRSLGELDKAAGDAEEARAHAASEPALLVQALTQVARVATDRADFARADASLHEALSIAEQLGDSAAQATVLRSLATLADRRGLGHEAVDYTTRAISAADRSGDASLRVRMRGVAAPALLSLSRYDAALATAQESYEIAERAGVPALRAAAAFALAQTQAHVWNLDRAAELWAATIEAHRETGNIAMVALALKQSVETWFALGEFDRAVADGEKAVELLRQTGQSHYVAETTARLALTKVRRGQMADARIWADRARAGLASTPDSRHLFIYNDLGLVESELGALAQARADFARVMEVAERIGNVEYEWRAEWGFGRTALQDDPTTAIAPLERAIARVERLRQTIPEAGLRAAFMINRVGPYETLVEAHMANTSGPTDDKVRRALEVAERARSRALADLLAEARARATDPPLAAVRDEETAFGRRFSAVQKRVAGALDGAARTAALQELRDLEREYEALVIRIRRDNPSYAALAHPRALSATELSAMLAPDEALIEFFLTDKQGFAWVVGRDAIRGYRVPGGKVLEPQVRLLAALLAGRDDAATKRLGAQLYTTLLAPAEPVLRGARRLIIVSDGVLQRMPFALLRSHDRWLVETHTIALAPSATILHFLRHSPPTRAKEPLLALAVAEARASQAAIFDGDEGELGVLAHTVAEVDTARRLVGAGPHSARTGAEATEVVLKSAEAGRYRILHLAAHAFADETVPRRSAVLLTPSGDDDGLLQVSEIANLSLNADLVVLAACRSHIGRLVRGEGLLSLSRAFIHAGARAVVATSWAVPDRDTAWLMRQFYAQLAEGLAPDEALQRAQLEALRGGGTRAAPAMWAAFLVVGEARTPILDVVARPRPTTLILVTGVVVLLGSIGVLNTLRVRRARSRLAHAKARGG